MPGAMGPPPERASLGKERDQQLRKLGRFPGRKPAPTQPPAGRGVLSPEQHPRCQPAGFPIVSHYRRPSAAHPSPECNRTELQTQGPERPTRRASEPEEEQGSRQSLLLAVPVGSRPGNPILRRKHREPRGLDATATLLETGLRAAAVWFLARTLPARAGSHQSGLPSLCPVSHASKRLGRGTGCSFDNSSGQAAR